MKIIIIILFLIVNFVSGISFSATKIILKLDDLTALKGNCSGKTTMDYLIKKQVKFSFGVIANGLDKTSLSTLEPYINATDSNGNKLFEIWHHGFDHILPEFSAHTFEYQKQHFENANQIVKNLLGIQMHSFGTPGNTSDSITNKIIAENPNYKIFMFSSVTPTFTFGVSYLNNICRMENGTGNVQFDYFLGNYNKYKSYYLNYMILQGHPNGWTSTQLDQFKMVIEFLISEGCEFVLPYEYYLSLQVKTTPILQAEAVTPRQVKLNWSDKDTLKINYKIERSEDSLKWAKIGSTVDSTKSYIDTDIKTKSGNYYYRVSPDIGIKTVLSNVVKVSNLDTDLVSLIDQNKLHVQVYPNPGSGKQYVRYNVLETGLVTCFILDLYGREYKKIFSGFQTTGDYQFIFDSTNFPSGIYLCVLNTKDGSSKKKIIIKSK